MDKRDTDKTETAPVLGSVVGSLPCHPKNASDFTIREIMRYSIMECKDSKKADEIQKLGRRLKVLISENSKKADASR